MCRFVARRRRSGPSCLDQAVRDGGAPEIPVPPDFGISTARGCAVRGGRVETGRSATSFGASGDRPERTGGGMSTVSQPIVVAVDGHDFLMRARTEQAAVYDFEWLTGPRGYGFTV